MILVLGWAILLKRRAALSPTRQWISFQVIEPSAKKPKQEDLERRRVVQTEAGEKVEKSDDRAFLSWQNQVVDRQTMSKNKRIVIGGPSKPTASSQKTSSPQDTLKGLGVPLLPRSSVAESDQPVWATPGTRPEDSIPGMKESDRTALNTKEYRFYSYFQRIRERLDRAWVPILRERLFVYYQSGRQLASDMDHTSKVLVILNSQGEIVHVKIVSESGTRDLDDAAVAAFNKAGPFPNPPRAMVDLNGEVNISWDFILKT